MRTPIRAALALLLALCSATAAWAAGAWSPPQLHASGLVIAANGSNRLMAVNAASQQIVWQVKLADASGRNLVLTESLVIATDLSKGRIDALNVANGTSAWTKDVGGELDGPPLLTGKLLVLRAGGKEAKLEALDVSNGTSMWTAPGATASVQAGDGDTLVVAAQEGAPAGPSPAPDAALSTVTVSLLGTTDGKPRWKSEPVLGTLDKITRVGPDVAVQTKVEQKPAGDAKPAAVFHVAVLSAADGKLKWQSDFPEDAYAAPRIFNGMLVAKGVDGRIRVHDLASGEKAWEKPLGPTDATVTLGPVEDGVLYALVARTQPVDHLVVLAVGPTGSVLAQVEWDGQAKSPLLPVGGRLLLQVQPPARAAEGTEPASEAPGPKLVSLAPKTLAVQWEAPLKRGLEDTEPVLAGGSLLVFDGENLLSLDATTGKQQWEIEGEEWATGAPLIIGEVLLAGTADQSLLVYELGTGKQVWSQNTRLWFAESKGPNLIGNILLAMLIMLFIYHARQGRTMYIRRIAGLAALDEAVGRATEMGKPVLYITGLADVDDPQTLASLSILGHVAKKTAEYETPILVPCCRSVVMSTAQEVVKEAHLKAGRPDTYQRENIRYLSDDQFGFVAGVDGIMLRDRPAANFYMGMFYAESLILAETGHSTGAIQIAGTAAAAQLPFFVAACDYTLIGEELYAASAYLSQDPLQVGSLKGQDWAKAAIMAVIIVANVLYFFYPGVKSWLSS